jgi:hypothetical protein
VTSLVNTEERIHRDGTKTVVNLESSNSLSDATNVANKEAEDRNY